VRTDPGMCRLVDRTNTNAAIAPPPLEVMSTAIAKNLMAEMKPLSMLTAFDQALTNATRAQPGCSEFFDTLLQAEADYR
jgi:hypothetical protein